jgi:hypothetical protein
MTSPAAPVPEEFLSRQHQALSLVAFLGPPLLGAVIASRRPANPYGWLWLAYALLWAVIGFGEAYATHLSGAGPGSGVLPWAYPIAWVSLLSFPPLLGLTALILLLFPDGRPPSRLWRWVAWLIALTGLVTTVGPEQES